MHHTTYKIEDTTALCRLSSLSLVSRCSFVCSSLPLSLELRITKGGKRHNRIGKDEGSYGSYLLPPLVFLHPALFLLPAERLLNANSDERNNEEPWKIRSLSSVSHLTASLGISPTSGFGLELEFRQDSILLNSKISPSVSPFPFSNVSRSLNTLVPQLSFPGSLLLTSPGHPASDSSPFMPHSSFHFRISLRFEFVAK